LKIAPMIRIIKDFVEKQPNKKQVIRVC